MSTEKNDRQVIQIALIHFLILIIVTKSSFAQQEYLPDGFPKEFLFTKTSNMTFPKGSYLIRVLVVGGGGGGCKNDNKGRGKAGDVVIEVFNLTLSKTETFEVIVGRGGIIPRSHSSPDTGKGEFSRYSNDYYKAKGGAKCLPEGAEEIDDLEERFGYFFMSRISKGRPGNSSNTKYGTVRGGEGGILINGTGPERTTSAQPGKHPNSSLGGEGYGAGGGSGGKHQLPDKTNQNAIGGNGAQGVVYIEVLPKVCHKPLRVFFALESGKQLEKQKNTVIGLLSFFTVSQALGKVELLIYKNQSHVTKFGFREYSKKDQLYKAIKAIQQDDGRQSSQVDYAGIYKSAFKAFNNTDDQFNRNESKTLVIFSEFDNIGNVSGELLRWKQKLREIGVKIMVIGIAENTPQYKNSLDKLVLEDGYVFTVTDVFTIKKFWAKFANMICREPSYSAVENSIPTVDTNTFNRQSEKLLKDYNFIMNYDITEADPYNSTEVKRVMTMAGDVIQNSRRMANASKVGHGLKVIQFLEDYGLKMAEKMSPTTDKNSGSKYFEAGNMGMAVIHIKTKSIEKLPLSQFIPTNQKESLQSGHTVVLPKEAFAESDNAKVVWLTSKPVMSMRQANNSFVLSKIMSINVEPKSPHAFERPVELTFSVSKISKGEKVSCEFWDSKRLTSLHGAWSTEGCKMVGRNETSVSCQCNHLTSFGILTRVTEGEPPGEHDKYLSIITYVGCSLSILGCILTIIIHACLPSLRTERSFIHLNLVTAILIAQSLFFAAASIQEPKALCFAIGIGLYLFYLSVFTWMLVEGLHIYCLVIRVFHTGHERKKLYTVIGWVFPLITTIVCAASFRDDFISEKICWLSIETGAIWSFVGPALVIIAINLIVLVLVLRVTAAAMMQDETKSNPNKSLVRACITLLPILGLTWLFGILAINNKTIVFEYLFCIFNSIQGLLIFLFYCIGSSEVRRECKRKLHNYETKRSLRTSSSGYKASKQGSSLSKPQSKTTELISQKEPQTLDDTRF